MMSVENATKEIIFVYGEIMFRSPDMVKQRDVKPHAGGGA
jgi:hypothetical protein